MIDPANQNGETASAEYRHDIDPAAPVWHLPHDREVWTEGYRAGLKRDQAINAAIMAERERCTRIALERSETFDLGAAGELIAEGIRYSDWHPQSPKHSSAAAEAFAQAAELMLATEDGGGDLWWTGWAGVKAALAIYRGEPEIATQSTDGEIERIARRMAAKKMGLVKDPDGSRLPDDLWRQALPQARDEFKARVEADELAGRGHSKRGE